MVQATKLLADRALSFGVHRLTLLSGVSYPIAEDGELNKLAESDQSIFEANEVNLRSIEKNFYRRFTSRHLAFKLGDSLFARIVRRSAREMFALLPPLDPERDLFPLKLTLGSQWWSVTSKVYREALTQVEIHPIIESYFKKIECSDESYFGTLFKQVAPNHQNKSTTYVCWGDNGRPVFLDAIGSEQYADYLFARKFSSRANFLTKK
jgi:Core-2/I-Branching enzyme